MFKCNILHFNFCPLSLVLSLDTFEKMGGITEDGTRLRLQLSQSLLVCQMLQAVFPLMALKQKNVFF